MIKSDAVNGTLISATILKSIFPELTHEKRKKLAELMIEAVKRAQKEETSLVVTVPNRSCLKEKSTKEVISSLISKAESYILLTGYSVSEYFSDILDQLIEKSRQGVLIKLFVNDLVRQPCYKKLIKHRSRSFKLYNYCSSDDEMAALHAKVISIDQTWSLITSANLSYHGQNTNIEIGTLTYSKRIANQIDNLFTSLIEAELFTEI